MSRRNFGALVTVPLIVALALAGCTMDGQVPGFSDPTPSPSAFDPAASPTLPDGTSQDRLEAGETVDAATADALRRPYYGYQMPDGTFTVVKSDEPLPPAVKEAVKGALVPGAAAVHAGDTDVAVMNAVRAESEKTGKTIILIMWGDDYEGGIVWGVSLPVQKNFPTKEEAVAAAEAATKSGDNRYAIIVVD